MRNSKKEKFNPLDLATRVYYSTATFGKDTTFTHGPRKSDNWGIENDVFSKYLLITNDKSALANANFILRRYFQSSQYIDATHKKFHIIDLDEYDHDAVSIKLTKTHKFKPVASLSKCQILTRAIARNVKSTNNMEIDPIIKEAFNEMLEPDDFFKFQEVRTEFRVSISLVKKRKVFKKINVNIGYFTLIVGSKPYDYQEDDSKQKKATRPALSNPVYKVDDMEFMAIFNDSKKYYCDAVDMLRI